MMDIRCIPVTPFQQNCSLLKCQATGNVALVDPGGDMELLEQALQQAGGQFEAILLTHAHLDHCAAAGVLREKYGVPIIGPQREDLFLLESLPQWSEMAGFPHADAFEPDQWLEEGDVVGFGEQKFEVLHCPGHTPGHVVFYHRGLQRAFVGDVIFQGSIGRSDLPKGDHNTLVASIRNKLWALGDEVEFVPGHGPNSTIGRERRTNPFVADTKFG